MKGRTKVCRLSITWRSDPQREATDFVVVTRGDPPEAEMEAAAGVLLRQVCRSSPDGFERALERIEGMLPAFRDGWAEEARDGDVDQA